MKTKFILAMVLIVVYAVQTRAQYFEFADSYTANRGTYLNDMIVSKNGNVYKTTTTFVCMGCQPDFAFTGPNFAIAPNNFGTGSIATHLAQDELGNFYVMGNGPQQLQFGTFVADSNNFFMKVNSTGVIKWIKNLDTDYNIIADSAGKIYLTNPIIHKTIKINTNGTTIWTDFSRGGKAIGVDRNGRCYITNGDSTFRYNANGSAGSGVVITSLGAGGNLMKVTKSGTIFLADTASLLKLNINGTLNYLTSFAYAAKMALDMNNNIYLTNGTVITKYKNNGIFQWTESVGEGVNVTAISVDNSLNVYLGGSYNCQEPKEICPFQLLKGGTMQFSYAAYFIAKISSSAVIPFQAAIQTGQINPSSLCKNSAFSIPFTYCTNNNSFFQPGNEFRAQISNDNFQTFTDIGTANNAKIPVSVVPAPNYRIRVVSTNPVVVSNYTYWNYSTFTQPDLTVINGDNLALVNASGPLTFCQGGSVKLKAVVQPYTLGVTWMNGNNFVSSADSIIVTASGKYTCNFSNMPCASVSDTFYVIVNWNPLVTIIPQGPTTFCADDSVSLYAYSQNATAIQWKKNNVNITGATSFLYNAKTAGTYRALVTNAYGCTKLSAGTVVTIDCRNEGETATEKESRVLAYPVPVKDILNIESTGFTGKGNLYIINNLGQQIIKQEYDFKNTSKSIDMSRISHGTYFVILTDNGHRKMIQIFKE